MSALLITLLLNPFARRAPISCELTLGEASVILERLLEANLISKYRAERGFLEPAEFVGAKKLGPRPSRRSASHVALIGPNTNLVFEISPAGVREVSARRAAADWRVKTSLGLLHVRGSAWRWVGKVPKWFGDGPIPRATFEAHFTEALKELRSAGRVRDDDLDQATFWPARYRGREIVYVRWARGPHPSALLLDVRDQRVLPLPADSARAEVEISAGWRLMARAGRWREVPSRGWAAGHAASLPDRALRTFFERFAEEVDALFQDAEAPNAGDLLTARVGLIEGPGEWRPFVGLRLKSSTLVFDPRERRWLDKDRSASLLSPANEDLPTPLNSSISNSSATFGP